MRKQKKVKIKKRYLLAYPYLLLILMLLFTVASYTWFTLSQAPKVSDLNMYVNSAAGLEMSHTPQDPNSWTQHVAYTEINPGRIPLRPVTWSDEEQRFYAAAYGADGRLRAISDWHPLNDSSHANKPNGDGYYAKFTVYARSGQKAAIRLHDAGSITLSDEAFGTFVMGIPSFNISDLLHMDGGKGAQNAMRIGMRTKYLDSELNPLPDKEGEFFIYEPNCNMHAAGAGEYLPTPSIDGTEHLINPENIIRQTATTWGELDVVQIDKVELDLGDFLDETVIFDIEPGWIVQIDIYIWLEGQDAECNNQMAGAMILANLQFSGDTEAQSGMEPIETE